MEKAIVKEQLKPILNVEGYYINNKLLKSVYQYFKKILYKYYKIY